MSIKRLCSIGLLNIKLNLILKKSFAENNNFNINDYNSIEDLEQLFQPKTELNSDNSEKHKENNEYINYINYISLSSDDNLLNTLFYINRAYKVKTFIEFLIPNEINFNNNFIKSLINEILCRNYFFVVENNIINKSSKIKFIIKILDDNTNDIISKKEFNLVGENNDIEYDIFFNEYFDFYKLDYNFSKNDFFLIDLDSIKLLKWKTYNELVLFILNIIQNNNNLKIILSLNENSLANNYNYDSAYTKRNKDKVDDILLINKKIVEFSDIIFCFKNSMNNFLKDYSTKTRTKILKINDSNIYKFNSHNCFLKKYLDINNSIQKNNSDLIIYDNNKYRNNIPRLSIILDDFDYLNIYIQEFDDDTSVGMPIEPYNESFSFSLLNKNHTNKEFRDNLKFLSNNSDRCFHIFIGGFLSRYINNADFNGNVKSYEECFIAGNLILKNYLILIKNNIDYITDIDEYNVVVPKIKKCLKERLYKQQKEELRKNRKKEKKFILDCTNFIKSQKKDYNSLLDFNCTSYLSKKNNIRHLTKHKFITQEGEILKDPGISPLFKLNKNNKVIKINKAFYHNNYNNIYNKDCNDSPIKPNKIITEDNNNKTPIFKKIFESYKEIKNKNNYNNNSSNIKNSSISKANYTNSSDFYNKNKVNSRNIYFNKSHKSSKLYLKRKTYDGKRVKQNFSNHSRIKEMFDSNVNNLGKYYKEYLFKLYQPKKEFNDFINSYFPNLKIKK